MPETALHRDTVCPFCSLLCDDLVVEAEGSSLEVKEKGCPHAAAAFAQPLGATEPLLAGKPAILDAALARAAELLRASRLPLLAGLGTDTAGMRESLLIAEMTGGIVDHKNAQGLMANLDAMRATGWVTGTLAEVRNHADVVLLVGTDGVGVAPRLFERCIWPDRAIDEEALARRRVVYLGGEGVDTAPGMRPDGPPALHLACPAERLIEAVGALRALVAGHRLTAATAGGIALDRLKELARSLREARYSVIVWAAGAFPPSQADLLVSTLAELTKELNARTRCVGLPLAGADNIIGANQICAWQTGFPLRTGFMAGVPEHEPHGLSADRLLAAGAVDCLLWVSSFESAAPPRAGIPTIALVRPGMAFEPLPEVLIPVGTPGLDHEGSLYRTDSVVALPVRRLRDIGLPTAASVLAAITAKLRS